MTYLLDTMVLSEFGKPPRRQNAAAIRWLSAVDSAELFLSVITLGEVRRGIELQRRRSASDAARLEDWLRRVRAAFAGRVIGVDEAVAERWGRIIVDPAAPSVDALVAATALVHDKIVVTRNIRHFERTGARLLNPYEPAAS